MFCPHCKSQLPPDVIFCPNCGQKIADMVSDETVSASDANINSARSRQGTYPLNPSGNPQAPEYSGQKSAYPPESHQASSGYQGQGSAYPPEGRQAPPGYQGQGSAYPPDYNQVPPGYYEPAPMNGNGPVTPQYRNPYAYTSPTPEKKKKKSMLPIIIALLTALAAVVIVIFIVLQPLKPGPVPDDSSTTEEDDSGYGEKTNTPTPSATPIPTATPTVAPTPTPAPTATPSPTPVPAAPASSEAMISLPGGGQAPASDFLFPSSSSELISSSDMNSRLGSDYDAQMAINEIYARYGYTFQTNSETAVATRNKFGSKDWYRQAQSTCPTSNRDKFAETYMNSVERSNIQALVSWMELH